MSKMTTSLWFDHGEVQEAAEFYAATFLERHVGTRHAAATDFPDGKESVGLTVEFTSRASRSSA